MKKVNKYVHPSNFVSNLDRRDKTFLLKCAKKRGIKISIEDKAFDGNSLPMRDLCAVFSGDKNQDMNDLWIEYNYMLNQIKKGRIKSVMKELG
jgi:hypothetical protein